MIDKYKKVTENQRVFRDFCYKKQMFDLFVDNGVNRYREILMFQLVDFRFDGL